ncbi:MAG: hypothetical protein LLF83_04880 [Methanobacterium sp.]|nr:hypothetical protein [Methanobacterium sp.]
MADVKEVKSVKIAPFTLMTAGVQSILAFIGAILLLLFLSLLGAFMPTFGATMAWLGVAIVIIYPIAVFFIGIAVYFYSAFLYNSLVSRLGGIKLAMEGSNLMEIPIVNFALILAVIQAIWAFIVGLFLAALLAPTTSFLGSLVPLVSQAVVNATNMTGVVMPTGAVIRSIGVVEALFLIIGLPIIVFIGSFILYALVAIFYNFIVTKVSKIKLEFAAISGTLHELKSIPIIPAALAIGVLMAVFGLIRGIIYLILFSAAGYPLAGVSNLIFDVIFGFVVYFIIAALGAFFYNYLAPKIGGWKLNLE